MTLCVCHVGSGYPEHVARDLCSVSNELAVSLLRQFDSLVHAEVAKASRALPCLTGVDREDFVAEGRVAVLDAHLTYRAERGGPKAAWVRVEIGRAHV